MMLLALASGEMGPPKDRSTENNRNNGRNYCEPQQSRDAH